MASATTFDALVTNPGRLRILTALATTDHQEFVSLRRVTGMTDGNLCSHTRRLETAGLVAVEKSFRDRKPVTHVTLTKNGRAALEQHASELLAALGLQSTSRPASPAPIKPELTSTDDDWVD